MSSQPFETDQLPFEAGEAIARRLLVFLGSGGKVTLSDGTASEAPIGVTTSFSDEDGDDISVNSSTASSGEYIASATIAVGAKVYTAAAGQVGVTASTFIPLGSALTAGGDGDIVHVKHTTIIAAA